MTRARLTIPHDEPNPHAQSSWPNPDHRRVDDAFERLSGIVDRMESDEDKCALLVLRELADAYLALATHEAGKVQTMAKLRALWIARHAKDSEP